MPTKKLYNAIAVIGLACWYPGAKNSRQLWENILARRLQFRMLPDRRFPLSDYYHQNPDEPDKTYCRQAAVIDGFDFDWTSKRIPHSTFRSADIAHWLALEIALEAIADAGYNKENIPGRQTGVLVGNSLTGEQARANAMRLRWPFIRRALRSAIESSGLSSDQAAEIEASAETRFKSVFPPVDEDTLAGGLSNTISGRICNYLNLHGGGYTVDGACSSSLLAVATAAAGLTNRDLDLALAGGVDISLDPFELIGFSKTGALAKDDMMVYDRRGSGFIAGEGCGFVVLKRLNDAQRDGNNIYAVIQGWGISSDGRGSGITAPSAKGQALALKRAYAKAPYSIKDIHFLEGHGTGTAAGDSAELEGIALAMDGLPELDKRFCGITSLKSLIGHTKAASGIGGFIKTVMAVNRRIIPPTAGCRYPHPVFDTKAHCLYPVLQGEIHKPTKKLRAGVSAMGFGGINCHVTLESGNSPSSRLEPSIKERTLLASGQETEIFVLTSGSMTELKKRIVNLQEEVKLASIAELTDLAAKLGKEADKKSFVKSALVAGRPEDLIKKLEQLSSIIDKNPPQKGEVFKDSAHTIWLGSHANQPKVGMLFPGQGSQMLNMARALVMRFPWAEDIVNRADRLMKGIRKESISEKLFRSTDRSENHKQLKRWLDLLSQTENAQPAICLASLLWHQFLKKLGVNPLAVGGHSLGELTAFYAAGIFGPLELIRLAALRGEAMSVPLDRSGTMVSLRCSQEEAESILHQVKDYLVLANINGPNQMVLSGKRSAVYEAVKNAEKKGIRAKILNVSNAFHSDMAIESVNNLKKALKKETFLPETTTKPDSRLFTCMNGLEIEPEIPIQKHFTDQILSQVNFTEMIKSMAKICNIFIEVGPGRVLSGLVNSITEEDTAICLPIESSAFNDEDMNRLIAALYVHGVDICWNILYEGRLVRPYVSPSEKLFIENPCERPFEVSDDISKTDKRASSIILEERLEESVSEFFDTPDIEFAEYLKIRGEFIAQVITADMKYLPQIKELKDGELKPATVSMESIQTKPETETALDFDKDSMKTILFQIIHKTTGFPTESLSLDFRLLDDLNLDSIKAGDLIAQLAGRAELEEGRLNVQQIANATLGEIISNLEKAVGKSRPLISAPEVPDMLEMVISHASRITGYPEDSIDADALIEPNLNIGQGLLKKLLQSLSNSLNMEIHVDMEPLLRRSLRQIADILKRIFHGKLIEQIPPAEEMPDTWVREFSVEMVEEPLSPSKKLKTNRMEDNWQAINVLILTDPENEPIAESIQNSMLKKGAKVETAGFEEAREKRLAQDTAYTHFIAILPQTPADNDLYRKEHLQKVIERLASITSVPKALRRRTTVAYIQFGGGCFGEYPYISHFSQCCATALGATLHLERTDLRVRILDFSTALDPEKISQKVIEEINSSPSFAAIGFDFRLIRRIARPRLLQPALYKSLSAKWSAEDVIMVTGGAKGITASCALGLAQTIKTKMVLIGRSPHPDITSAHPGSREIEDTLQKYKDRGLVVRYFSCDVSDPESVNLTIGRIQNEMGPITGVIHGAGINVPQPTSQVTAEDALSEVSPKVLGAMNLMAALKDAPLKIFAAFSSIIGVTGMPGNAWYGFSNEALNLILQRFQADHPNTRCISMAYGIWRDEGMGLRMGSVGHLRRMGIYAIPSREGVKRFVRLILNDPGTHQVIITARLGNLDTWNLEANPLVENARYLEKLIHTTPGVESVFKSHLTLQQDPYLKDHLFNGSYLFPTVFGLEAMAQAVAHVTGKKEFGRLRIENIDLKRPITVDPLTGTDIVVKAEVREQEPDSAAITVHAAISKSLTETGPNFFSATFVLNLDDEHPVERIELPDRPLDIQPRFDLYRENLLFQGPLFHRIYKIWTITEGDGKEKEREALFNTQIHDFAEAAQEAFSDPSHQKLLLGDPFFRDSLLQSAQMIVPYATWLPIYIKNLDIYPSVGQNQQKPSNLAAIVRQKRVKEKEVEDTVTALDSNGRIVERLDGYKLRIIRYQNNNPGITDLVEPDKRDNQIVNQILKSLEISMEIDLPKILLKYIHGIHDLPKKERHKLELPLLREVVIQAAKKCCNLQNTCEVEWLESGKPVVRGLDDNHLEISLAHDGRLCLCTAGNAPQGCDIAPVTSRNRQNWTSLLGKNKDTLLDTLIDGTDHLDRAGTRIWAATEALRKAYGNIDALFEIVGKENDAVLFRAKTSKGSIFVLTISVDLTRGPGRIIALTVQKSVQSETALLQPEPSEYEELLDTAYFETNRKGPQGQTVFIHRFPVTFRPNAQLSRTVYFSNYFFWIGEIREAFLWPILKKVRQQFATGKWGSVTNYSYIKILGEATAQDKIEIRLWSSGNGGPADSTMDLTFDILKQKKDDTYERIAWLEQQVTWVSILDKGIVKPEPYPAYYSGLIKNILPQYEAPNSPDPMPEFLSDLAGQVANDKEEYRAPAGPAIRPVLYEQIIETSLDHSNLAGNIYFANYYAWQGQTRDRYFFQLIPKYFYGTGEKGELLCIESRVDHLREAMPFDRILITMALKSLKVASALFYFEYFRLNPDGTRLKLAYGEQNTVWTTRNSEGKPEPKPFPSPVQKAFSRAVAY